MKHVIAVCILLIPAVSSRADDPAASPSETKLRKLAEELRDEYKVPALGVAICNSKGVQDIVAVGVRKRGSTVAVTVDDTFHVASDTKAMTSTLIGLLVEDGKLSWDLTLAKAFPELEKTMPGGVKKVTLKHLLTHRAGLPPNPETGWWKFHGTGSIREQRYEVVKQTVSQELKHPLGKEYVYSNLGYVLAAAMAEKATGKSWEELITKRVFAPLGMKSAGFGAVRSTDKIEQPWPHDENGKPKTPNLSADNPPVMSPAGRIHCSMRDWSKFLVDQMKGGRGQKGLLKSETYKTLHTVSMGADNYVMGGWILVKGGAGDVWSHDGNNTLNYATAWIVPKRDLVVLAVCNQGGSGGEKACRDLAIKIIKDRLTSR